jgi:hypothetical protein
MDVEIPLAHLLVMNKQWNSLRILKDSGCLDNTLNLKVQMGRDNMTPQDLAERHMTISKYLQAVSGDPAP